MLAEIFKAVLIMSAVGGMLIAVLLMLKPLTRRMFGDKWQFYIWLAAIIVLILPVKFEKTKLFNDGIYSGIQMKDSVSQQVVGMIETFDGVYSIHEQGQGPHALAIEWFYVMAIVWAVVATMLLVKTVIAGISLKSSLYRNSVFVQNLEKAELRECNLLASPILIGGLKPVLYIPEKLKDSRILQYIIAHETVHIKRNDISIKWFAALARCVHWFNPLVYVAAKQIDEACEISCDVEATREMTKSEKTKYMQTVLEISQDDIEFRSALMVGLTVDGRILKKRFVAISKFTKNSHTGHFLGIVAAFAITFFSVCFCGIIRGSAERSLEPARLVLVDKKDDKEIIDEIKVPESTEKTIQSVKNAHSDEQEIEEAFEEEADIESPQRTIIRGEFNSKDGDMKSVYNVCPDESGCISIKLRSNAQETIDVYIIEPETGKEVYGVGIPVPYETLYKIDGLDFQKKYNIILKGPMRNNWVIESEYMIY